MKRLSKIFRCPWRVFSLLVLPILPILAMATPATEVVTYYYTDPQGTVLATTDAQGNVLTSADHRPYGEQMTGATVAAPGYGGHIEDIDSGFVYMQARYFDPATGRFISVDPLSPDDGEIFSFNRFVYANNNPVSNFDPAGLSCEKAQGSDENKPCTSDAPPVDSPIQMAGITVTASSSISGGTASLGSRAIWAGGLVALGASLYVVDSNSLNDTIRGVRGCYGDASCQGSLIQYSKKKVPKSNISGKDGAKDVPSWVRGERPFVGESGKEFADRLIKGQTGQAPKDKGPGSDWSKIKKYGDRNFEDP